MRMGIIDPISKYFFEKELLSHRYRNPGAPPLKDVRSILLIISEPDRQDTKALLNLADERFPNLESKMAVVVTTDKETAPQDGDVVVLGRKDFSWKKTVKVLSDHPWLQKPFDMLINFDTAEDDRTHFISAAAKAELKVGHCANPWKIYDLLMEGENSSCETRWNHLSELLKSINADL